MRKILESTVTLPEPEAPRADAMVELQGKFPDMPTDALEAMLEDIYAQPIGFIKATGDKKASAFYNALVTTLKERGVEVDPEKWIRACKEAPQFEAAGPPESYGEMPKTFPTPMNRKQRRAQAATNRKYLLR